MFSLFYRRSDACKKTIVSEACAKNARDANGCHAYWWWIEKDRPLILKAEVGGRATERVPVRASVASAVRIAPNHLANADLATTADLGKPFLIQYILDQAVLHQHARTIGRGLLVLRLGWPKYKENDPELTPSLLSRKAARCAKPGTFGSTTSMSGMPACFCRSFCTRTQSHTPEDVGPGRLRGDCMYGSPP